ncbi:hypothetical protein BDV95DRAFT_578255 [Massariosphaeria phaeospora]|uniref:Uncharacterized protein n=1 Tax=Massariosphaeria phaeospora TaxID=100035 RepID=A0A7C8M6F4_9PLEO|nr:hypothetical protein BDV95DRAFT_578255 [Massariosphaeria phaeospora]
MTTESGRSFGRTGGEISGRRCSGTRRLPPISEAGGETGRGFWLSGVREGFYRVILLCIICFLVKRGV